MHFLTSIFQQSRKNVSMLYQWESLCKASDGCNLRTYPALPSHHPHPWTRSYPTISACSQGGMCKQSLAREALGSFRCQCFGHMRAARSEAEQPQEGAGNGTNCSSCCPPLACHSYFSELLAFLMAENGNAEALPWLLGKYTPGYNTA